MARKYNKTEEDEGPKAKTIYTIKLSNDQMDNLGEILDEKGWIDYDVAYSLFAFKGEKINVVGYQSGKLVVQGKKTEDFVRDILEPQITGEAKLGYEEVNHPEWFEDHLGVDESGKGDLFGPLVSCTVVAHSGMAKMWMDKGIRDSKSVSSDASVFKLEKIIRETEGVVIKTAFAGMVKYNELYNKFGNLNKMLAWFHSRSVMDSLKDKMVPWGMLDQFTKQPLVQRLVKVDDFTLRMQTKAEADPVVAAASIIARAEYVRQMKKLSDLAGETLLKGASAQVKQQAVKLVRDRGADALNQFAKMHFKTATEALNIANGGS